MEEISQVMKDNLDDIVLILAPNDQELTDGIKFIDYEGRKLGLDFYQMYFKIKREHDAHLKAQTWLKLKGL